jgi:L-seryl-tRNA(Ser) seleniumtransferase
MSDLRELPSVEQLLQTRDAQDLVDLYGRQTTLEAIRETLAELRVHHTPLESLPQWQGILSTAQARLVLWHRPTLVPVINASGVVLHTNLGRAPLSKAATAALQVVAGGYSTLEFDLESGKRGSRLKHAEELLIRLTGAEAALVVNNNAAAVLLALMALARHKRVIISRTQLVEIGGGFRVPDIMSQSGAKLVEVGATNRVHLVDYEEALREPAAMVLHAHHSNFRMIGFTSEPELAEIARAAHRLGVLMADDLGSGALLDTTRYGLGHEPTVQDSLAAGVDLVCFSGDKLLGGPQAGIITGRSDLVAKLKRHPLARALRADKLCLASLSATLLHYLKGEAEQEVPVWRMISASQAALRERAEAWKACLEPLPHPGEVIPGLSTVGGGSLPGETLPTFLLAVKAPRPDRFLARLRKTTPPVIARVEDDQVLFDPRTVLPEQDALFITALRETLQQA